MPKRNNGKRARHLRKLHVRQAVGKAEFEDMSRVAEGTCPRCGYHMRGKLPPFHTKAISHEPGAEPLLPAYIQAFAECRICGGQVELTNLRQAVMPDGSFHLFFSTDDDVARVRSLLGALEGDSLNFSSADALADYVEAQGGALFAALADWIRGHQDALIAALVPSVVALLIALLQGQQGIGPDELDEILEQHSPPDVVIVQDDQAPNGVHRRGCPEQPGDPVGRGKHGGNSDDSPPPSGG